MGQLPEVVVSGSFISQMEESNARSTSDFSKVAWCDSRHNQG